MFNQKNTQSGILYVVATPIGHVDDLSRRAIAILQSVDCILAEDTRHSQPFLRSLGIVKPLWSFHAHNEDKQAPTVIAGLEQGQSYALISDAGTPLMSDPGFSLIRLCRDKGLTVVPIPGPCAFVTALCAAGIPCNSFTFVGFLPSKSAARQKTLTHLKTQGHTLVCYESAHRILSTVEDLALVYGADYRFMLAKELTKIFETFIEGTSQEIASWLSAEPAHQKGEFVLMLPATEPKEVEDAETEALLKLLLEELSIKQAIKIAVQVTKKSKNCLYEIALRCQKSLE